MPIIIVILASIILAMGIGIFRMSETVSESDRNLTRTTRHLDSKSGGTKLLTGDMINYNLKTWDSGNHWYAIEYDGDWGVIILGEAEEIYPGLLRHLDALDNLLSHGPITNSADLDLLRAVGFTVEEKE